MLLVFQMLKEDLRQYGGEEHLRKVESLRSATSLQEHWMELGQAVLNRHRDVAGAFPPQRAALEEIKQRACEFYQQFRIRISGDNGKRDQVCRSVFPQGCQESSSNKAPVDIICPGPFRSSSLTPRCVLGIKSIQGINC